MRRLPIRHALRHLASGAGVLATLGLAASCSDDAPPEEEARLGEAEQPFVSSACADGTGEDQFTRGMVGCAGQVAWGNRATLCAPGFRPATSHEWLDHRGSTVPSHNYWTDEQLRYTGTAASCSVSYNHGSICLGSPMRVCTPSGTDPEGNDCAWQNCAHPHSEGGNAYFGGCSGPGNGTAGTLCVPVSGCADGTVEQTFGLGVIGCAGSSTYANAGQLCGPGFTLVEANHWQHAHGATAPTHNYWTKTKLSKYSGTASSCAAWDAWDACTSCMSCPSGQPMHVCTPSGSDAEGNDCTWDNCRRAESSVNHYYGGCSGASNATAGALCKPSGPCADGSVEQEYDPSGLVESIVGCAGHVSWDDAHSLCGEGHHLIKASDWALLNGNLSPTHNYWTATNLRHTGTSSTCAATESGGASCPAGQPMHICTPSGSDAEGNDCNWQNCGFGSNLPNESFGGCVGPGNDTAGSLCVFIDGPP